MSAHENLDTLRKRHPIDVFDRRVVFRENAAVRAGRLADDVVVDEETGAVAGVLPPDVEVRGHVYFLDGVLVTSPSMTGFLKNYFPGEFDPDEHSLRIATGADIMRKPTYKYYQYAREHVETTWLALGLDMAELEAHYATPPTCKTSEYLAFRAVHDPVVRAALVHDWAANGQLQSGLGKTMHRSIELFYNENPTVGERFETVEFGYFRAFHRDWVEAHGLVMYRTELSLCYFDIKLCGMIDAMFVFRSDLESGKPLRRCVLVDWKRANDLQFISYPGRPPVFAKPPFAHLPLCDGSKYYAQLNGYKCILEQHTEFRVASMHIAVFHPNEKEFRLHTVPDLQPQFRQCVANAAQQLALAKPVAEPAKQSVPTKQVATKPASAKQVKAKPAAPGLVRKNAAPGLVVRKKAMPVSERRK